jgi:hypothetical protein
VFQLCCFHVLWCKSVYSVWNLPKSYLSCKGPIKTAVLEHITNLDWTNC